MNTPKDYYYPLTKLINLIMNKRFKVQYQSIFQTTTINTYLLQLFTNFFLLKTHTMSSRSTRSNGKKQSRKIQKKPQQEKKCKTIHQKKIKTTMTILSIMDKIEMTKTLLAKNVHIQISKRILQSETNDPQSIYTYIKLLHFFYKHHQSDIVMILDALNLDTYFDFMIKLDNSEKYMSTPSQIMFNNLVDFVLYKELVPVPPQVNNFDCSLLDSCLESLPYSEYATNKNWLASLMFTSKAHAENIVKTHITKYLPRHKINWGWGNGYYNPRSDNNFDEDFERIFNPYIFKYTSNDITTHIIKYTNLVENITPGESMLSIFILSGNYSKVKFLVDVYGIRIRDIDYLSNLFNVRMSIPIFRKLLSSHMDIIGDHYQTFMNNITKDFIRHVTGHCGWRPICKTHATRLIKFVFFLGGKMKMLDSRDYWNPFEQHLAQFQKNISSVEGTSLRNLMWKEMVLRGLGTIHFEDDHFYYVELNE